MYRLLVFLTVITHTIPVLAQPAISIANRRENTARDKREASGASEADDEPDVDVGGQIGVARTDSGGIPVLPLVDVAFREAIIDRADGQLLFDALAVIQAPLGNGTPRQLAARFLTQGSTLSLGAGLRGNFSPSDNFRAVFTTQLSAGGYSGRLSPECPMGMVCEEPRRELFAIGVSFSAGLMFFNRFYLGLDWRRLWAWDFAENADSALATLEDELETNDAARVQVALRLAGESYLVLTLLPSLIDDEPADAITFTVAASFDPFGDSENERESQPQPASPNPVPSEPPPPQPAPPEVTAQPTDPEPAAPEPTQDNESESGSVEALESAGGEDAGVDAGVD